MEEALSDLLVNFETWCRFIIVIVLIHKALTPFTVLLCEILGKEEVCIGIIWYLKPRTTVLHFCPQITRFISAILLSVECDNFKLRKPFGVVCNVKVAELIGTGPRKLN